MNNLSNDVYHYYLSNWMALPFGKQFHFASRLHLWHQSAEMKTILEGLKTEFTHSGDPLAALQQIIEEVQSSPVHGSKNAAELRRPYFEKYPNLKMYVSVLFRLHFINLIYGIDCRDLLFRVFSRPDLERLKQDLLTDTEALAILSTHAVNFLYLYERSVKGDEQGLPLERFMQVGRTAYDLSDNLQLQLYIYLYTHCIIGESLFYGRSLPDANFETYRTMLQELEATIETHYDRINLDNKCEFLVCAKIVGQPSKLEAKIMDEASRSISDDGTFIIDRFNQNPQTDNATLEKSEHRNVLYIMANRSFTPLG